MTLRQFLESRLWLRAGGSKCLCPFHNDRTPSAVVNPNNIYCFAESRVYGLRDFQDAFGVVLDEVPDGGSVFLGMLQGRNGYPHNAVLFSYDFN
jgi:hypothetical protein